MRGKASALFKLAQVQFDEESGFSQCPMVTTLNSTPGIKVWENRFADIQVENNRITILKLK